MKLADWLKQATEQFEQAGIGTARLDCLVLLEDVLGKDRTQLLARPELSLTVEQIKELDGQLARRIKHEPLSFIRAKTEFYGREFIINKHVLEPRPESETMIDLLKQIVLSHQSSVISPKAVDNKLKTKNNKFKVIDIGTGSGALAITAKLEIPEAAVIATDIDAECLKIARQNAKKHGANIKFLQGDLLEPIIPLLNQRSSGLSHISKQDKAGATVLLANLPYVPDSHTINEAAMFEPKHAIFGGEDGLDLYRRLFDQIKDLPNKPPYILTESLPFQHEKLAQTAKTAGYKLAKTDDFIQVFNRL